MKTALVLLALCRLAAAGEHVSAQYELELNGDGVSQGIALGYEHRFADWYGVAVRARGGLGDAMLDNPASLTIVGATAGFRVHTPNPDDLVGAFAGIEVGWMSARTGRSKSDLSDEIYPVSWDHHYQVELALGIVLMKYVQVELRVEAPIGGSLSVGFVY